MAQGPSPKNPIPSDLRWQVWERDNFTCHYCGTRKRLAIDHKIPECVGGKTRLINLLTSCVSCNSRKGSMLYEDFIRSLQVDPTGRELVRFTLLSPEGGRISIYKSIDELNIDYASDYLTRAWSRHCDSKAKLRRHLLYLLNRLGKDLEKYLPFDATKDFDLRWEDEEGEGE